MKKLIFTQALIILSCITLFAQYRLVWQDEFNEGSLPNQSNWSYKTYEVNEELQRYISQPRSENARIENGKLIIEVRHENYGGKQYSSARLESKEKVDFLYGRIEARIKLPAGRGTWPAFWLMPTDFFFYATNCSPTHWVSNCDAWPNSGEIDIMEYVGYRPDVVQSSVHCKKYSWNTGNERTKTLNVNGVENDFHIYALEWYPNRLEFFVDDNNYFTIWNDGTGWEQWPFDKEFNIILNVAFGGSWGGQQGVDNTIFINNTVAMEVDYVRLYEILGGTHTIPGKIEAEEYSKNSGMNLEFCKDDLGINLASVNANDYLEYDVNVEQTGVYDIQYRIAGTGNLGNLIMYVDEMMVKSTVMTPTSSVNDWKIILDQVSLVQGNHKLKLKTTSSGLKINWIQIGENTFKEGERLFADYETINLTFNGFGGSQFEKIANPVKGGINNSDNAGKCISGIETWAGIYSGKLNEKIDFQTHSTFRMKVYSPKICTILVKFESDEDNTKFHEISRTTTKINEWEVLTFDFSNAPSGIYDKIVLFFDYGGTDIRTYYFDDLMLSDNDGETVSVYEIDNELDFNIYPNPTKNQIIVSCDSNEIKTITVLNSVGTHILKEKNGSFCIQDLKPGIYFIRVEADNKVGFKKIIKI